MKSLTACNWNEKSLEMQHGVAQVILTLCPTVCRSSLWTVQKPKDTIGTRQCLLFSALRGVVSQTSIQSDKINVLSNLRTAPNLQCQVPNLSVFQSYTSVITDTKMILARRVQALGWCLSHKDSAKSKDPGELLRLQHMTKSPFISDNVDFLNLQQDAQTMYKPIKTCQTIWTTSPRSEADWRVEALLQPASSNMHRIYRAPGSLMSSDKFMALLCSMRNCCSWAKTRSQIPNTKFQFVFKTWAALGLLMTTLQYILHMYINIYIHIIYRFFFASFPCGLVPKLERGVGDWAPLSHRVTDESGLNKR